MRRIFVPFVLLFALMFAGCTYDDSELVERIEELERSNNVSTLREQVESLTKSITALETLSAKLDELSSKNSADILDLGIEFEQLQEYVEERLDRVETHTAWLEDIIDGKIEDALSGGADTGGNIAGLRLWVEGTFATLGQYDALSEDIAQLESALSTIQDDLAAYKQEVEESFDIVGDELVEIENNISNMSSDIQDLYDIVNELEESIKTDDYIFEQFQSIEARLAEHSVDISELDNRLNAVEQQSETFASHIEDLYAAIEEMKSELVAEYKRAIETAIMENGGVIDAKIEAEIEEVNARVNAELESIKERIDGLEQRIDDLEDALDKIKALDLEFDIEDGVACMAGASIEFGYRVIGGDDDTEVESFGDGGWRTRVTPTDATQGCIKVTAPKDDAEDGKIVVLATSGAGGTCMKAIYFDRGIITDIMDSYETSYMANTLAVTLKTNLEYDVEISAEAQSWISCADTRAELREDTLSFTIEENLYDEPRTAVIHLVGALGDKLQSFEIVQQKSPLNAPIQFADQNVKRVCVEKFDTNGDGELSYKEAAAVTEIGGEAYYISFFGDYTSEITSFDELQYFIGIKTIGDYAFFGCSSLTSVTIPDSVTTIGVSAFSWCSSLTSITIPDSVTSIRGFAFQNCDSLTSVTIPYSVTTIGNSAFSGCSSLTSVTIPDSVTSIGYGAFSRCNSLTSVTIPDSVTSIGDGAFSGCSNLTAFYGKFAFEDNRCLIVDGVLTSFAPSGLTAYNIPDSVTTIGGFAFQDCDSLTSVTIPDSVTTVGGCAFYYCDSLTSVTIPDSVTTIGDSAFSGCDSLTSVYCMSAIPPIGGLHMFSDNATGRKIYVPIGSVDAYKSAECWSEYADDIYEIQPSKNEIWYTNGSTIEATTPHDSNAFGDVTIQSNLYDTEKGCWVITFDGDITTIGYRTFYYCDSLTSVTIPDSVTTIGNYAFRECRSLISVTIPDSVTTIGDYALSVCDSLTSVTIPDSVTTIGKSAFKDCDSLTSVTIPDSVTTIGDGAFSCCSNLTAFYGKFASEDNRCLIVDGVLNSFAPSGLTAYNIPDSVTTIGGYAFSSCKSLTSITIPDSVTTIGEGAFSWCDSLTSVYCKPITPPTGDYYMFYDNASGPKIYVPAESVGAYKSAVYWNSYADAIVGYNFEDSGEVVTNNEIWYTNGSTTEATVPYDSNAFGNVAIQSNLYDAEKGCWVITFDGDVTMIRDHAFQNCTSLTSVTIPDSVTTIGISAFYGCRSLTSVTIPDSVTTIGYTAFYGCRSLTSVTIPDSVTGIGGYAFYDCRSLTSVTIPDRVTAIVNGAFSGCSSLKEFKGKFAADGGRCLIMGNTIIAYAEASGTTYTILDSVTTIGISAFYGCRSLTSVTIPDSVTLIGDDAFCYCSNLTSVTIPDSVMTIGNGAFRECASLTSVYCKPITPPTGDSVMFGNNASDRKIYVPAESVEAYKAAAYWSDYADAIVGYDFGNAGITDWNNVYVRSAFDDCKVLRMEASGFTGEFFLYKLGAKKSDALAAAVYTVGAWEYTTSRDYCEDASSKINGVTLKSGEVVVETSGDGYKVTFNVVDKNGTEWKGTYTGGITQP